jgi:hypothetical protein
MAVGPDDRGLPDGMTILLHEKRERRKMKDSPEQANAKNT